MRLVIEQPRLLKSLQTVERAVNDRSALPILANILIETTERELVLTATDLDVGVQYRLPMTGQPEQGAVTLPARRLATIIRELPEEPVTMEAKKNYSATVSCGASHFRLQGLPPEDFPVFPVAEQTHTTTIPQSILKQLITHTAFAMSLEETRFVLNGTLLQIANGTVTLAAADGRRLAVASAPVPGTPAPEATRVVVPAKAIRELGRLLDDAGEDPVTIAPLKDNQVVFRFGEVTIISRLIDGQFPQYESAIPEPSRITVTCDRGQLANAIRRASLMTTATSQAVVFDLAKDRVIVSKESPEVGSAQEELPASYTGEPMTIGFNPAYWLDVLKVLDAAEVTIEFAAPPRTAGSPAEGPPYDRAAIRLPQLLYLVMAMKLS